MSARALQHYFKGISLNRKQIGIKVSAITMQTWCMPQNPMDHIMHTEYCMKAIKQFIFENYGNRLKQNFLTDNGR